MTQYKAVRPYPLRSALPFGLRLGAASMALAIAACATPPKPATGLIAPPAPTGIETTASPESSAERNIQPVTDLSQASGARLNSDAPLRYVVKKGDTLWGISTRFLADPWQWPELWYVNGQLANPHQIYPGQVLELYNVNGRTVLARGDDLERLGPQIRESLLGDSLPAIPIDAIRNFLKGPRAVDLETLNAAPYLLAFADEHIIGAANMEVYIKNLPNDSDTLFSTVRRGVTYIDPDTKELLGYEAIPSGEVEVQRFGAPANGMLTKSSREILPGDRLLPPEAENYQANFYPHVPTQAVGGKIISVYDGVSEIAQYQIVAMNRGSKHGLEPGHVLSIYQAPRAIKDPVTNKPDVLPAQNAGLLMVFKTMPGISYGLIMEATRAVHVLDRVEKPDLSGR